MSLAFGTLARIEESRMIDGLLLLSLNESRLDAAVTPLVRSRLVEAVGKSRGRVIVDLGKVNFVDSTGLGLLVQILKIASRLGNVGVACMQPQVELVFALAHLDKMFPTFSSIEAAIRATPAPKEPPWTRLASNS
jgi:anti-sigma B factor antagonist